jgi:hypothetical protein
MEQKNAFANEICNSGIISRKKKKIKRGDLPEAQLKALYNCC